MTPPLLFGSSLPIIFGTPATRTCPLGHAGPAMRPVSLTTLNDDGGFSGAGLSVKVVLCAVCGLVYGVKE